MGKLEKIISSELAATIVLGRFIKYLPDPPRGIIG
jgi:hypothetical protein